MEKLKSCNHKKKENKVYINIKIINPKTKISYLYTPKTLYYYTFFFRTRFLFYTARDPVYKFHSY